MERLTNRLKYKLSVQVTFIKYSKHIDQTPLVVDNHDFC